MNLTIHEKKALIALQKKSPQTTEELMANSGLPEAGVNRAIAWLQEKGLCSIEEKVTECMCLDDEGKKYASEGLPERLILNEIKDGEISIKHLTEKLGPENVKIGTVWLRRLNLGMILSGNVQITPTGKSMLDSKTPHEKILDHLKHSRKIPNELKDDLEDLKKRGKIMKITEEKDRKITITADGLKQKDLSLEEEISDITAAMIKDGSWKNKKIREYNVEAPVPIINPGKLQAYYEFLDETREKMIAMGFKEMKGNIVQTEFWNFDVLTQPQMHPTRTERDTYYLKSPKQGNLMDKDLLTKVLEQQEKRWKTKWDEEKAKNLIMRTHTTCLSAKELFKDKKYPLRYFSIGRVFRKDVIDATHLPEFNQLEGIVADESLTLRDLLGILETFGKEIAGCDQVKFKCGYFPYTEPSVELFAKHPKLGWKELGGAGMFRPEMLDALGVKVPVIAWGMGIDRLAMYALGIDNIRDLFSQDLKVLQNSK